MNRKKKMFLLTGLSACTVAVASSFVFANFNKTKMSIDAANSTKELRMTPTVLKNKYFVTSSNNRVNITVNNYTYNSNSGSYEGGSVTNSTAIRQINSISCGWYNTCSAEALKFEILDSSKNVIASKTGAGMYEDMSTGKIITSGTLTLTTTKTTGRYFKVTILAYSAGSRSISGFVVNYTCN